MWNTLFEKNRESYTHVTEGHLVHLFLIRHTGDGLEKREEEKRSLYCQALTSHTTSFSFSVMLMWVVQMFLRTHLWMAQTPLLQQSIPIRLWILRVCLSFSSALYSVFSLQLSSFLLLPCSAKVILHILSLQPLLILASCFSSAYNMQHFITAFHQQFIQHKFLVQVYYHHLLLSILFSETKQKCGKSLWYFFFPTSLFTVR